MLHILVTSRKERDIECCLVPRCWRTVSLQEFVAGDIKSHVRERVKNDKNLKKWPATVQVEIEEKLTNGACGM
jgi:hypothetical protein